MSEPSILDESQTFIPTHYPEEAADEQLNINYEIRLSVEKTKLSIEQSIESSLSNNLISPTIDDSKSSVKNPIQKKYPLTEKSKREKAAKIRMECEIKSEKIKNMNEIFAHGAEVIKSHSKMNRINKLDTLKKIKNHQWYNGRSVIYDDVQSPSFKKKLETLEFNLKNLEKELVVERDKLTNMVDHNIENTNYVMPNKTLINENINLQIDNETIKIDFPNSIECLDESSFMDIQCLDKFIHKNTTKMETRLTFSPKYIEFKVMKMNFKKKIGIYLRQQINVTNCSKNNILCRYSNLFDPNSVLKNNMNIIKVTSSTYWYRLLPGMTGKYIVTFKQTELPNLMSYLSLKGIMLEFETQNFNRPEEKYVFHIPVKFYTSKPEPELITKTIIFSVIDHYSSQNINPKKYLILKNSGDADCVFSMIKETEYQKEHHIDYSTEIIENDNNIISDIIDTIIYNMFSYFMWRNHINVLLPAKGSVKVPVIFNQNLAYSTVSECYIIEFDNTEYEIQNLKVNIIGRINDQILVHPDVIDVGLCYLTGSVQMVSFNLRNNSRIVIPFKIKLPRELCKYVEVSPSKGYLKAKSSIDVSIRINLKYNILQSNDCKSYFNEDSGFLDFPVRIYPTNSKKDYEVRVLTVVTTSFGLKLNPDILNFGTVHTTETVVRSVMLANHSRTAMAYGFLKLPERVSIQPNSFGTIFSGEHIYLHIHYSPSTKYLPKNIFVFKDEFLLTCNTITGLNAEELVSENQTTEDKTHKIISKEFKDSTSMKSHKSANSIHRINELDHGPDKIKNIPRFNSITDVISLEKNILKDASIKCHAVIHDIPVEVSVQKIIFGKTHYTSYSIFNIELRALNLISSIERNIKSFPDFKIRFEFISNDTSVEFKPNNGILRSKEAVQICAILRPKIDNKLQNIYEECHNSEIIDFETEPILEDPNSLVNQTYRDRLYFYEQIRIFKANKMFYTSIMDKTKIISATCFIQFVDKNSVDYFGFDTGSLKLSLVCPITKPNIILFSDQINFGRCTMNVRHNQWILIQNITTQPVPLKISLPNPTGPFFCAFVIEKLDITSETMKLTIKLCGSGIGPSCTITPNDIFNIIQTTHQLLNNKFIFRITNTSGTGVRFNVQLEWVMGRTEPMTDDEAYHFAETLRTNQRMPVLHLDGPEWTQLDGIGNDIFDLENDGRPLWFNLDSDGEHYVQVTFRPPLPQYSVSVPSLPPLDKTRSSAHSSDPLPSPYSVRSSYQSGPLGSLDVSHLLSDPTKSLSNATNSSSEPLQQIDLLQSSVPSRPSDPSRPSAVQIHEDYSSPVIIFRRRVYVAKLNVHVGKTVLRRFYVIGFIDETSSENKT